MIQHVIIFILGFVLGIMLLLAYTAGLIIKKEQEWRDKYDD